MFYDREQAIYVGEYHMLPVATESRIRKALETELIVSRMPIGNRRVKGTHPRSEIGI